MNNHRSVCPQREKIFDNIRPISWYFKCPTRRKYRLRGLCLRVLKHILVPIVWFLEMGKLDLNNGAIFINLTILVTPQPLIENKQSLYFLSIIYRIPVTKRNVFYTYWKYLQICFHGFYFFSSCSQSTSLLFKTLYPLMLFCCAIQSCIIFSI